MKYSRELGPTTCRPANEGITTLLKRVVGLLVLCLLGLHSHVAMAYTCTFHAGYSETVSTLVLPASLTVKRDLPVGTIIYDSGWNNGGRTDVWCDGGTWTYGYAASMTPVAGMPHTYQSGVPGIGIKAAYSNNPGDTPANIDAVGSNGSSFMEWPRSSGPLSPVEYIPAGINRVEFVVTGPIPVGSNTMQLPAPTSTTMYNDLETNRATFTVTTFTVNSVGCTVGNNNIGVPMDAIQTSALSGVGTTSTYKKDFSIDLMCPDSGTAVSYQIDDMGSSGLPASTGVLANGASAPRAAGVGVQVLKSDGVTVVPLSTRISYLTTSANNQSVSIPMFARYYQTAAAVTGGYVVANATFTMFYQ